VENECQGCRTHRDLKIFSALGAAIGL